jgi:hypothetical protein
MRAIRVRTDEGVRNGIELSEGKKYRHCLFMNAGGLRVEKIEIGSLEDRSISEIAVPLPKAIRHFKQAAKEFGCSAEVAEALGIRRVVKNHTRDPQ